MKNHVDLGRDFSVLILNVDVMLDRARAVLASDSPRKRDVESLQNWVDNQVSIARDETAYLSESKNLMTILSPRDDALARLTFLTERVVSAVYKSFNKVSIFSSTFYGSS